MVCSSVGVKRPDSFSCSSASRHFELDFRSDSPLHVLVANGSLSLRVVVEVGVSVNQEGGVVGKVSLVDVVLVGLGVSSSLVIAALIVEMKVSTGGLIVMQV